MEGQVSILRSRADQLRQEIEGPDRQRAANEEQINFIIDELRDVRGLYDKSLVSKTRWLALERERARLSGEIGRAMSDRAKAEKSIGETELQITQTKQKFQEDTAATWSTPGKSCVTCVTSLSLPETRSVAWMLRPGHRPRSELESVYSWRRRPPRRTASRDCA